MAGAAQSGLPGAAAAVAETGVPAKLDGVGVGGAAPSAAANGGDRQELVAYVLAAARRPIRRPYYVRAPASRERRGEGRRSRRRAGGTGDNFAPAAGVSSGPSVRCRGSTNS